MSRVLAVAPAVPGPAYPQHEITDAIGPLLTAPGPRRALLHKLHASSGVTTRHLALPLDHYARVRSFGTANAAFIEHGLPLAVEACERALADAGLAAADVEVLVYTTVTGVGAPALDAQIAARLGLRPDVVRVPSFGWGCAGGAAGIARTHDLLAGRPTAVALLVSVELCSLTIQHDDDSTANLVSSGLFGDGATAVVLAGDAHPGSGPTVIGTRSHLLPNTTDQLGWDVRDTGFGIVLSPGLPDVLRDHLADDVKLLLTQHGLDLPDVDAWVVHAGGPKIIDAVRDTLGLAEHAVRHSRARLAATGNLSSSSVLHVLAATLADAPLPPGGHVVLMAFGPGVSIDLVLLEAPC